MHFHLDLLAGALALIVCAGIAQAIAGFLAARRFRDRLTEPVTGKRPPMTILKPLCGDEPLLEQALASICAVDYPDYQVVFGVQDPLDPAIAVVDRLRARFPERDISLVVNSTPHGRNQKIANLINMLPAARHDFLVIGDSDVHVTADYLDRIAAEFARPRTGLITTVYAGLPANRSLAAVLGATALSHGFLPGALMARGLGRQDTLGATMALRRETLDTIGGLPALANALADDHLLGRLARARGLAVRLAATLTSTTVPEHAMRALWLHELRWSRTVLSLVPVAFVMSWMQYPLLWALLAIAASGVAPWTVALFLVAWIVRAGCALGVDKTLGLTARGLAVPPPPWLLPLRDILSMAIALASYFGDRVQWRGQTLLTDRTQPRDDIVFAPADGVSATPTSWLGTELS